MKINNSYLPAWLLIIICILSSIITISASIMTFVFGSIPLILFCIFYLINIYCWEYEINETEIIGKFDFIIRKTKTIKFKDIRNIDNTEFLSSGWIQIFSGSDKAELILKDVINSNDIIKFINERKN